MIRKVLRMFHLPQMILCLTGLLLASPGIKSHQKTLLLMGSRFEITAVSDDEQLAWDAINAAIVEIKHIEATISSWDSLSQTSAINRNAGQKAVPVDQFLFDLIERSKKVSQLTNGAFDISYASMDKIWYYDGRMKSLPSPDKVRDAIALIDFNKIVLNRRELSIFLQHEGMKIGFGAIGKGFAADRAKAVMLQTGIQNGVVNAGGDLISWGKNSQGENWQVGIADPRQKEKTIAWLNSSEMAVVTSGNYEKFVEINGTRYGHIIDPRSGYPVDGLKSVTIICSSAELADAMATAVFILGAEEGLTLINQISGVDCILVTNEKLLKTSNHLKLNYY